MRKVLFALCLFFPLTSMAQLVMTPDGFTNQEGKNYLVIEAEGSQSELYQKSLTYLNGLFNSPNETLSVVEGQSITVNGFMPKEIKSAYKRLRYTYDLDYTISFEFKDGKVKYEVLSWEAGPLINVGDFKPLRDYYGVFSESLELQNEVAKNSLELFFNTFLSMYEETLLESEDW